MKTQISFLALLTVITLAGMSQENPLNGLIEKYAIQEGFYFLDVNTNMMSDEPGNIIHLKLLSFEQEKNPAYNPAGIYDEFFSQIDKNLYKGLVEVKSSGDNMEMLVRKEGEKIAEVIVAVKGDLETILIAASGTFTLKNLAKFGAAENCRGFKVLEELCEE